MAGGVGAKTRPSSRRQSLLDKRIERFQKMKLIEAKPTNEIGGSVDARLPPPIPDRRYRRF
jgi:hypothetical protein